MDAYAECQDCEFVLLAAEESDPVPRRWEACPECGGTDFCLLASG